MTPNNKSERDDESVVGQDLPLEGDKLRGEDGDGGDTGEADNEGELEALPDAGHLNPEGRLLDFFSRRSPCHVVGEHVREQGSR